MRPRKTPQRRTPRQEPRPHDLLLLKPGAFRVPERAPLWVRKVLLEEEPWVVVRRAAAESGSVPAGVRGDSRRERYALAVPRQSVVRRVSPEDLAAGRGWRRAASGVPAFAALDAVAELLEGLGFVWGPVGSVGYQLAAGRRTATQASDLDVLIRSPEPFDRNEARNLVSRLSELPVRVDAQLDTGRGAISLSEWAAGGEVMLRREDGPALTRDPWSAVAKTVGAGRKKSA